MQSSTTAASQLSDLALDEDLGNGVGFLGKAVIALLAICVVINFRSLIPPAAAAATLWLVFRLAPRRAFAPLIGLTILAGITLPLVGFVSDVGILHIA